MRKSNLLVILFALILIPLISAGSSSCICEERAGYNFDYMYTIDGQIRCVYDEEITIVTSGCTTEICYQKDVVKQWKYEKHNYYTYAPKYRKYYGRYNVREDYKENDYHLFEKRNGDYVYRYEDRDLGYVYKWDLHPSEYEYLEDLNGEEDGVQRL